MSGMSVFLGGSRGNESELGTNKSREPQSGSRATYWFRAPIHSPMNPVKKTLIPYIYNASSIDPFKKFSDKPFKFKIPKVTGTFDVHVLITAHVICPTAELLVDRGY